MTRPVGGAAPRLIAAGLLVGSLLAAAGCGGKGVKLVPVDGRVYLDDQPIQAGETLTGYVVFHADPAKGNASQEHVQGEIGPDGTYRLMVRDRDGAPPGWYKVTVDVARTNPKDPYDYKRQVADRFLEKDRSGLAVEVVEDPEPGRYDLRVKSK
jgi:hypothetical protein